ncbi:MAG: serpin family protein, partial [Prevotella sp.]
MKRVSILVAVMATVMAMFAQNNPVMPGSINLSKAEQQLVNKNNGFAFKLFREALQAESMMLSPLSITYALGMLNNGATGTTQQEICDV